MMGCNPDIKAIERRLIEREREMARARRTIADLRTRVSGLLKVSKKEDVAGQRVMEIVAPSSEYDERLRMKWEGICARKNWQAEVEQTSVDLSEEVEGDSTR